MREKILKMEILRFNVIKGRNLTWAYMERKFFFSKTETITFLVGNRVVMLSCVRTYLLPMKPIS